MAIVQTSELEMLLLRVRRHALAAQVRANLRDRCGFAAAGAGPVHVLASVSGGADSVALLLLLRALAGGTGLHHAVTAVHVDHQLRPGSGNDRDCVVELCRRLELRCVVRTIHVDVRDGDGNGGGGGNVEAAARQLRYAAFGEVAIEHACSHVAVGHHARDQAETVLMHLFRGSGGGELRGMAWSRPLLHDDIDVQVQAPVQLIRPMLDQSPEDCCGLCVAAGVEWVTDPTNADRSRARNRLRHDVLPVVEAMWPGACERIASAAERGGLAQQVIDGLADDAFGRGDEACWDRATLAKLPVAVLTAGLRRAFWRTSCNRCGVDDLTAAHLAHAAEHIRDVSEQHRVQFDWPGGMHLVIDARRVHLLHGEDVSHDG
ncbi:MAG: tRNA lysidine(34) synthetase TilS [Phycisphaerales bacterium]